MTLTNELGPLARKAAEATRAAAEAAELDTRPTSLAGQTIAARMEAFELGLRGRATELGEHLPGG
ncbi:hypothetical protein [Mycobacterium sp. 1274756.6]|uniref:hypothetical protein n=1 Tax=Mycobacterium sp. 1274756.6 TaxID=1834076 RepID=UPI000A88B168|nr:hypothetical protein [Mycobacterium sp. 1274756.6]